jgi:cytochrome c5
MCRGTNAQGLCAALLSSGQFYKAALADEACAVSKPKSRPLKTQGERMNKTVWALLFAVTTTGAWAASGEDTYKSVCATCHAQGVAGSPKVGDTKVWGKLIKEGQAHITADGYNGVRSMPPRGGRSELTVTDFGAAVVYMANQSGASWQDPDEAMLKKINARIEKRSAVKK